MQIDFGFEKTPYKTISAKLEITETELIDRLKNLTHEGFITRIGPFFNIDQTTGYVTLVAMEVPESNFETVAQQVNSYLEVAHNYKRNHRLNMWFVLATTAESDAYIILKEIEKLTGLKTYNFPKLQEFNLDLFLKV